ncbi:hypothetical protein ACGF12_35295 [Kitasatospora sp. NPDC048296]|uniref:hypothetical protein n=1 Tax=Kitasatospora sp. NPDC048296 TaxID=3364048 RepID=UPI003717B0EE
MATTLNTLNQWTRRRRWAVTGMFTVVLAALCMTLFVAGVCLQVRSPPTATPASRLTIGIGLLTAGTASCFGAKTRTHKICTATKKAAEQLAGECRALDGGAEPDAEDLQQQIRDLDVLLATPLPTTVKLTGLPLLTQAERGALIHDHLLGPPGKSGGPKRDSGTGVRPA